MNKLITNLKENDQIILNDNIEIQDICNQQLKLKDGIFLFIDEIQTMLKNIGKAGIDALRIRNKNHDIYQYYSKSIGITTMFADTIIDQFKFREIIHNSTMLKRIKDIDKDKKIQIDFILLPVFIVDEERSNVILMRVLAKLIYRKKTWLNDEGMQNEVNKTAALLEEYSTYGIKKGILEYLEQDIKMYILDDVIKYVKKHHDIGICTLANLNYLLSL